MKFTPESLIEIYLNGSFTEDAQAEFDALMSRDAAFAEKVTNSIAERMGPIPEEMVERVSGNLDGKMDALWQAHKPSPWARVLKTSARAAILLAAAGGFYGISQHFWLQHHSDEGSEGPSSRSALSNGSTESNGPAVDQVSGKSELKKSNRTVNVSGAPTVVLSFKEMPAVSGSNLSTPSANENYPSGNERVPETAGLHRAVEPAFGSAGREGRVPSAGTRSEEGDALRVSIEMENRGKVAVTVMDSNGIVVRRLYQGLWDQGVHYLDWDGKDETGSQVQPGNYTVTVQANGKTMSGTLTIKSDH